MGVDPLFLVGADKNGPRNQKISRAICESQI